SVPFTVDLFAQTEETEPNNSASTGQAIGLPATVVGAVGQAGDIDFYRFQATAGQQVGVHILTAAVGSKLEPVLQLIDPAGRVVAESSEGFLGHTCAQPRTYALGVRGQNYRGGSALHYRLHVGQVPVVTAVYPLGLQRGTEAEIHLEGVHLGDRRTVRVKAPAAAAPGSRLPVPIETPLGKPLGNASV